MKHTKLTGIALITMLTLTAIIAASASAATLPNILPEGTATNPFKATSSSGTSTFGNGLIEITSSSSKGQLESNQTKLGAFDLLFEKFETKTLKEPCTGLNDSTTGSVLMLGTYHIRDFDENSTLLVAFILLLKPVHFWCLKGATPILETLSGCVAGAITPENKLTKVITVTFAKNGIKNDNLIITILNEENTSKESCQLLAAANGGAAELSAVVTAQLLTGFENNGGATEVLVMRL